MINVKINHTEISVSNHETLVEGNVNSIFLNFSFSPEWENIARVAVFTNGDESVAVTLSSETCAIPWEVLRCTGKLYIALRGIDDSGSYVICTENESLGTVHKSNADGEIADAKEATPDVLDSLLADIAEIRGMGGKSAYDIALENGFIGTEAQWLSSLKGANGITPYIGNNGNWYIGSNDTGKPSRGKTGANGANGTNGINGTNGRDGRDGHTPVKGVDYWTASDKTEIVGNVLAALPTWTGGSY